LVVLTQSLKDVMKSPISRWTTIGASSRYFGQFASDYYVPLHFLMTYPTYKTEFALAFSIINMVCGFISSLGGGMIADRFGKGRPMCKAWVCVLGSMLAMPFFMASVLITDNFWLAIACTAARFLLGEPFRSPSVTMIQNSSNPEKFGNLVSAYQFYQKMTTVFAAFIIGGLFNYFGATQYPQRVGPILAGIGAFAYSCSAFAYFFAGKHYIAFEKKIKYRSIFSRNRKERGYDSKGFKKYSKVPDYGDPIPKPS